MFTIAASGFFTRTFYLFLNRVEQKIYGFLGKEVDVYQEMHFDEYQIDSSANSSVLLELQYLEMILQKAFDVIQEKRVLEKELVQVAAQAAHDICSPLAVLSITLRQIPNITATQQKYLESAEASITSIAKGLMYKYNLIKNKQRLAMSLADEKKNKEDSSHAESLTPVLIADLLANVVMHKKILFEDVKVKITLYIKPDVQGLQVAVNPHLMQRILSNIINNAAEAIMTTERALSGIIDITLERQDREVVIIVSDNGCGMSADLVEKIGQSEYTMGKKEGHGLGLYYAIKHIKSWGGAYKIDTKLDIGTQFKIYLPVLG